MQSSNQFKQSPEKGLLDEKIGAQIFPCSVDDSEAGTLVPGQAVKMVDSIGGVPKVIASTAQTDDHFGFVQYDYRKTTFKAGDALEIVRKGILILEASEAIARNGKVSAVISGAKVEAADTTEIIIGRALDKATANGDLIRVIVDLPGQAQA